MERLSVTISGSGLDAEVRVSPGPAASVDELRGCLEDAGVVHGIDERALEQLASVLEDPGAKITVAIAHGSAPIAGEDGYLRSDMFEAPVPGTTAADGTIDYRERRTLWPAAVGDVVADIVAPTVGTPGQDVRGRKLEATTGKPHGRRLGEGVRAQGDAVVAERDGVMLATDRAIDVVPLFTHGGNVDYASGNLHTRGSLLIQGDVGAGFTAAADGDIEITGTVQDGGVSAGGSVHVERGILGHEHAVRAGVDIRCHHATSARLIAQRSIEIDDQASEARLVAPAIRATEGRGAVRGGELRARETIEVKDAGCASGITTVLAVADLLDERVELARRTVKTSRLKRAAGRQSGVNCKSLRAAVQAGDQEITEQLRLRERQNELLRTAKIRIKDTCQPGVVLKFGEAELRPDVALGPSIFHFDCDQRTIVREDLT